MQRWQIQSWGPTSFLVFGKITNFTFIATTILFLSPLITAHSVFHRNPQVVHTAAGYFCMTWKCHTTDVIPRGQAKELVWEESKVLFVSSASFAVHTGAILCKHNHHCIIYAQCSSVCNGQTLWGVPHIARCGNRKRGGKSVHWNSSANQCTEVIRIHQFGMWTTMVWLQEA